MLCNCQLRNALKLEETSDPQDQMASDHSQHIKEVILSAASMPLSHLHLRHLDNQKETVEQQGLRFEVPDGIGIQLYVHISNLHIMNGILPHDI